MTENDRIEIKGIDLNKFGNGSVEWSNSKKFKDKGSRNILMYEGVPIEMVRPANSKDTFLNIPTKDGIMTVLVVDSFIENGGWTISTETISEFKKDGKSNE